MHYQQQKYLLSLNHTVHVTVLRTLFSLTGANIALLVHPTQNFTFSLLKNWSISKVAKEETTLLNTNCLSSKLLRATTKFTDQYLEQ